MSSLNCFLLDHGYTNLNLSACCLMGAGAWDSSYSKLHTNKNFIEIKQSMDQGIWHTACEKCRVIEVLHETDTKSRRQLTSVNYTSPDYNKSNGLVELQLSPGYMCNLQCRSCKPTLSSSWIKEDLALPSGLSQTPRNKFNIPINIDQILKYDYSSDDWSAVKYVTFVGGEPLYNPEFYTLLEKLLVDTDGNCDIAVTTNCTVPLNLDKYQLLTKFKSVHLTLSVDAVGSSAEFIRTGTSWDKVVKNIQFYKSTNMFKGTIDFHLTNSVLNILETTTTLEWLESMDIPHCGLTSYVSDPPYLSYSVLTDIEKEKIITKIAGTKSDYIISALANYQYNSIDRSNFLLFMEHTKNYHGQDWKEYLPALYDIMSV